MNHLYTILVMLIAAGWIYGAAYVSDLFIGVPIVLIAVGFIYALVYGMIAEWRKSRS